MTFGNGEHSGWSKFPVNRSGVSVISTLGFGTALPGCRLSADALVTLFAAPHTVYYLFRCRGISTQVPRRRSSCKSFILIMMVTLGVGHLPLYFRAVKEVVIEDMQVTCRSSEAQSLSSSRQAYVSYVLLNVWWVRTSSIPLAMTGRSSLPMRLDIKKYRFHHDLSSETWT